MTGNTIITSLLWHADAVYGNERQSQYLLNTHLKLSNKSRIGYYMSTDRHGLSIGIERTNNTFFLSLKITGKLTHEDYEIITPMINSALEGKKNPEIKALVDGTQMEGWELRAAWDDFKIGVQHGSEFKKIAVYGNKNWQEIFAIIRSWFISGEVKYFESYDEAISWLAE